MNTSSVAETKTHSVKGAFSKAIPESLLGRVFFWGTLPSVMLLFAIGVSFLCASPFSLYLPFLALLGGFLCMRWKTIGLCGTYLALSLLFLFFFKDIPVEDRWWQMGILFSLAVNFFILLLSSEEIESLIAQTFETERIKAGELVEAQLALQQLNLEKEELQRNFEEEIRRLTEEAEARIVEKQQENKKFELIQSEIELLTSQKAFFVAEAKKARLIIEQDDQTQKILQDAQEKIESLEVRLYEHSQLLEQSRASEEELTAQVALLTEGLEQASTLQSENASLQNHVVSLTEKLSLSECDKETQLATLTEKLHIAFNEKEAALSLFENDYEEKESQLAALNAKLHLALNEKEAALSLFEKDCEEKEAFQSRITALTEELNQAKKVKEIQLAALSEKEALLAEMAEKLNHSKSDSEENKALQARLMALTEAEMRTKEALLLAQDKMMTLQVSPVIKVDDKKIRQLEGLYNQLRGQFEEKACVLSQTRKELFHKEEKLMVFEHEKELTSQAPDRGESAFFEMELGRLAEETATLEEEIAILEDLIEFNN